MVVGFSPYDAVSNTVTSRDNVLHCPPQSRCSAHSLGGTFPQSPLALALIVRISYIFSGILLIILRSTDIIMSGDNYVFK